MFKIILFFYLVRMIKSPSSVIFMLSYGLLVCQIDSCIHAYPSLPSIDAVSVFASCSNSYSGCLSLWELLLVCSVCQGATDVYFSMLSGSVLMGCSHSLCFRVFLLFLSSEPLLQAVQITCIMLVSTSALVLVTHILVLSIVASCIFDFHSSCRIGNFFCKMEFVACMHPVDGGGQLSCRLLEKLRQSAQRSSFFPQFGCPREVTGDCSLTYLFFLFCGKLLLLVMVRFRFPKTP